MFSNREIKVKSLWRYSHTPIRIVTSKEMAEAASVKTEQLQLTQCRDESKRACTLWKAIWSRFKTLKIYFPRAKPSHS